MNDNLVAIQTRYNGYHFRSRLEARWAVFFDCMGIEYKYENQGYDLGEGIWYLPDFYLPRMTDGFGKEEGLFFEVKPELPSDAEWKKAVLLAEQSGKSCYVTRADIGPATNRCWKNFMLRTSGPFKLISRQQWIFNECGNCGSVEPGYPNPCDFECRRCDQICWSPISPRLESARWAASSCRFQSADRFEQLEFVKLAKVAKS